LRIALDATYSIGDELSGVGVYSNHILRGLASLHPDAEFAFCYRPHRFLRSFRAALPTNARRRLLLDQAPFIEADVFHGLNQRLPGRRMRRAVSTFHDLFVLTGDYSTPEFRARFAQQARNAAARSDLLIAVSEFTASQVEALLHVERSRLRVVPHGVNAPAAAPDDNARENLVLHVGAIQHRKNVARLVEAFERLPPDWKLVLAGSTGYGAAEILDRIARSPARGRIEVMGYVSRELLERLYAKARIFAFPSLDEGFGMPLLDAMAWGAPAIASKRSAMPEVAGGAAFLVDPEDTEAIAQALRILAANEDVRKGLAETGRKRAAHFSWRSAAEQTWTVYKELVL
jgi:glycosyltransferase involved in cell wall biosynthesis